MVKRFAGAVLLCMVLVVAWFVAWTAVVYVISFLIVNLFPHTLGFFSSRTLCVIQVLILIGLIAASYQINRWFVGIVRENDAMMDAE